MAITVTPYNHTARRFAEGANLASKTYKVMLCTAATFNAANTTLASVTKTEVASGSGYTTGGQALTGVAFSTVGTNGAMFDANDLSWTASGGDLTASYGILFCDTDADDPPLLFIDFGGSKTAGDSTDFKLLWNADGIYRWTYPA